MSDVSTCCLIRFFFLHSTINAGFPFSYKPGDVLMVQPSNLRESVSITIAALALDDELLDKKFILEPTDVNVLKPPVWLIGGINRLFVASLCGLLDRV